MNEKEAIEAAEWLRAALAGLMDANAEKQKAALMRSVAKMP